MDPSFISSGILDVVICWMAPPGSVSDPSGDVSCDVPQSEAVIPMVNVRGRRLCI